MADFLTEHVDPAVGLVQFGYYGDWVAPVPTPKGQVVAFSHILALSRMADMAVLLNNTADAARYSQQHQGIPSSHPSLPHSSLL